MTAARALWGLEAVGYGDGERRIHTSTLEMFEIELSVLVTCFVFTVCKTHSSLVALPTQNWSVVNNSP